MVEARDAFLASLCQFALHVPDSSKASGPTSPTESGTGGSFCPDSQSCAVALCRCQEHVCTHWQAGASTFVSSAGKELARRNSSAAHASSSNGVEEAFVLTPKNVQALRTLFNIAHRLDHHLGKSWFMVLDNLNTLDRILHSPRTTTQVRARRLHLAA